MRLVLWIFTLAISALTACSGLEPTPITTPAATPVQVSKSTLIPPPGLDPFIVKTILNDLKEVKTNLEKTYQWLRTGQMSDLQYLNNINDSERPFVQHIAVVIDEHCENYPNLNRPEPCYDLLTLPINLEVLMNKYAFFTATGEPPDPFYTEFVEESINRVDEWLGAQE